MPLLSLHTGTVEGRRGEVGRVVRVLVARGIHTHEKLRETSPPVSRHPGRGAEGMAESSILPSTLSSAWVLDCGVPNSGDMFNTTRFRLFVELVESLPLARNGQSCTVCRG